MNLEKYGFWWKSMDSGGKNIFFWGGVLPWSMSHDHVVLVVAFWSRLDRLVLVPVTCTLEHTSKVLLTKP